MVIRRGLLCAFSALLALVLSLWAHAAFAQAKQSLLDVLTAYEAQGFAFVYSSDLVRESILLEIDSNAPVSIPALKMALARVGLALDGNENSDGSTTWYVVPMQADESPDLIEGFITDAQSGEPLAQVKVEIAGQIVYTDADGRFQLSGIMGPGLQVSRVGYQPKQIPVEQRLDAQLRISLQSTPRLEEVVVVSSRYALQRHMGESVHTLSAHDLDTIPEFGDDALRAASYLPGTATIGLSARPYIRGGLQDETLVLFNNVELLEPFHLKDFQSVFSGFNPSLVKSIDVYTGGFPARYGDRMSGVMDIEPANRVDGFGVDVMVSFLTASAALAGTTSDKRGSWALSARRGNLDLVLDVLDPGKGQPNYSDYYGSFSYALSDATEIETGFLFYDDDIELKDIDDGDGELARSIYRNGYGWLQLHRRWSDQVDSTTVLSYGNITNDRDGFINDEDLEEGSSSLDDRRQFELWHLGHRQNMAFSDSLSMEFGGRLNYQTGRYDTLAIIERGLLGAIIGEPIEEIRIVRERPAGTSGSLYGSFRYLPRQWLSLEAGLRWDYQDYTGRFDQQTSPRFSALLNLSPLTELRFSIGRFHQAQQIHELQAADGVDVFQRPQYADHTIIGLQHIFGSSGLSARLEGFQKSFRDPKRRFENLFNPLVLIPEIASDRIEVAPTRARARGAELTLAYESDRRLHAWLSYTHAYVDDELQGKWVKRGWDQRHSVSGGIVWEPGRWSLSAAMVWHSGWQTTSLPQELPLEIGDDDLPDLSRNSDRLPDYAVLNLKVAHRWRWQDQSLTVFAELSNALNRANVGAYEYDVEVADGGYELSREPVTLLPRIPSLGIRWTFN